MNKFYYSTVIDQPADRVWSLIRDFNSYPVWVEGIKESHIEDGKAGDAVGAIRNFSNGNARIRQRLLAPFGPRSVLYFRIMRSSWSNNLLSRNRPRHAHRRWESSVRRVVDGF
jgi:Polyketide cyclase / dehydrase and lipid transport